MFKSYLIMSLILAPIFPARALAESNCQPYSFNQVAGAAATVMGDDAKKLLVSEQVQVSIFSVRTSSSTNGKYLGEYVPELGIRRTEGMVASYEVTGRAVGGGGGTGARIVEDNLTVFLNDKCEILGTVRQKKKVFIGCYGHCDTAVTFDSNVRRQLYELVK